MIRFRLNRRHLSLYLCAVSAMLPQVDLARGQGQTNDSELILRADAKRRWQVQEIIPWALDGTRITTKPGISPDMSHKRAVVIKDGVVRGFLRVLQAHPQGTAVAPLAHTIGVSELRYGDILCDFTLEQVPKKRFSDLDVQHKQRIQRSIASLGADDFDVRERATEFLAAQGRLILPELSHELDNHDPEVRMRAQWIWDEIRSREFTVSDQMAEVLQRVSGRNKPAEQQGFLGIGIGEPNHGKLNGALVTQVIPGSPAQAAGLKVRDVITVIGDTKLFDSADLLEIISARDPGQAVPVTIVREGRTFTTNVVLTRRPTPLP